MKKTWRRNLEKIYSQKFEHFQKDISTDAFFEYSKNPDDKKIHFIIHLYSNYKSKK